MQNVLNSIITLVTIIVTFVPLVISGVKYIGIKTNNRQVITIADRAAIIVSAIDNLDVESQNKQSIAIRKLVDFANEISIPLTVDQATDYVEDAVRVMHQTKYEQETVSN